jgi:hypothetical protein
VNVPALRRGLGDDVVAAAMNDRLVHHGEVAALTGDSSRLKTPTSAAHPPPQDQLWTNHDQDATRVRFQPLPVVRFRASWAGGRASRRSVPAVVLLS